MPPGFLPVGTPSFRELVVPLPALPKRCGSVGPACIADRQIYMLGPLEKDVKNSAPEWQEHLFPTNQNPANTLGTTYFDFGHFHFVAQPSLPVGFLQS